MKRSTPARKLSVIAQVPGTELPAPFDSGGGRGHPFGRGWPLTGSRQPGPRMAAGLSTQANELGTDTSQAATRAPGAPDRIHQHTMAVGSIATTYSVAKARYIGPAYRAHTTDQKSLR